VRTATRTRNAQRYEAQMSSRDEQLARERYGERWISGPPAKV